MIGTESCVSVSSQQRARHVPDKALCDVALRMQINMTLQLIALGSWEDEMPAAERSPSPEPSYDAGGARTNTRVLRRRDALNARRDVVIEQLIQRNPDYKPPTGWRPARKVRKVYFPQHDGVDGSKFAAVVIGPGGRTQRELEQRTGATITVRCANSLWQALRVSNDCCCAMQSMTCRSVLSSGFIGSDISSVLETERMLRWLLLLSLALA